MNKELVNIIEQVARIPSFSSYVERLHPFILDFIRKQGIQCDV